MLLRSVGPSADGYEHERYHNYLAWYPCDKPLCKHKLEKFL